MPKPSGGHHEASSVSDRGPSAHVRATGRSAEVAPGIGPPRAEGDHPDRRSTADRNHRRRRGAVLSLHADISAELAGKSRADGCSHPESNIVRAILLERCLTELQYLLGLQEWVGVSE